MIDRKLDRFSDTEPKSLLVEYYFLPRFNSRWNDAHTEAKGFFFRRYACLAGVA